MTYLSFGVTSRKKNKQTNKKYEKCEHTIVATKLMGLQEQC